MKARSRPPRAAGRGPHVDPYPGATAFGLIDRCRSTLEHALEAGAACRATTGSVGPTARRPGQVEGVADPDGDAADPAGTTSRPSGEPEDAAARRQPEARPPRRSRQARPQARGPRQGLGELPAPLPARPAGLRARAAHRHLRAADLGVPPRSHQRAGPHDPHPEHRGRERREGVRGAARGLPQRPGARGAQARHRLGRRGPVHRPAAGLDGRRERTPPAARRRHPARRSRAPEGAADPGHAAPHPRAARRLLAGVPGRDAGARGP